MGEKDESEPDIYRDNVMVLLLTYNSIQADVHKNMNSSRRRRQPLLALWTFFNFSIPAESRLLNSFPQEQ